MQAHRHEQLKAKHRLVRDQDGFSEALSLRAHRALSWLNRAEQAGDDHDAAFIFYWIAFNAAYAAERGDTAPARERHSFGAYFEQLIGLDSEQRIYAAIWETFPGPIRVLLENRYVFQPFWNHHNGLPEAEDWERRFERSKRATHGALQRRDTTTILSVLFDRLYVLRNQLIHGGATWNSKVNRAQVQDGARILAVLVPHFIDLMMDNPGIAWGAPNYPVVAD